MDLEVRGGTKVGGLPPPPPPETMLSGPCLWWGEGLLALNQSFAGSPAFAPFDYCERTR